MTMDAGGKFFRCDGENCESEIPVPVTMRAASVLAQTETAPAQNWLFVVRTEGSLHFCPLCQRNSLFVSMSVASPTCLGKETISEQEVSGENLMFQKILACSDGSTYSVAAVEMAAIIAKKFEANLKILSVFNTYYAEPAYMGVWAFAIPQETIDECARSQQKEIEQQAKPILERLEVTGEIVQETGHPAECIVEAATREQSDLVVMGSRGLGTFKSLMLGSISDAVLHHAPCPVLILRGEHSDRKPEQITRILFASDGSEGASKAMHTALSLAQKFALPLTVLNIFEPAMPLPGLPVDEGTPREGAYATLSERVLDVVSQDVRHAAENYGVLVSCYQETGDPSEAIVRFAEEHHFDLIVMGSRGLGTFRALLGSVSDRVAHHAHCPVLIVR
jgi:nucleotide-binding universal stress UspA family protein